MSIEKKLNFMNFHEYQFLDSIIQRVYEDLSPREQLDYQRIEEKLTDMIIFLNNMFPDGYELPSINEA